VVPWAVVGCSSVIAMILWYEREYYYVFLVFAYRNIRKPKKTSLHMFFGQNNVFLGFYSNCIGKHKKTLFNPGTFHWASGSAPNGSHLPKSIFDLCLAGPDPSALGK
jgi:hypothetical protein